MLRHLHPLANGKTDDDLPLLPSGMGSPPPTPAPPATVDDSPPQQPGSRLTWLALKTTGPDPDRHVILEIATLVTDDDLQIVAEGPDLVVSQPPEVMTQMNAKVRATHTYCGLLNRVASSRMSLDDAGVRTLSFLQGHIPEPGTVPLCGNSMGTDRRFLARYLPDVENYLHYRSVDVSTVRVLAQHWYHELPARAPLTKDHSALDDIHESLEMLRWYRRVGFIRASADGWSNPPTERR